MKLGQLASIHLALWLTKEMAFSSRQKPGPLSIHHPGSVNPSQRTPSRPRNRALGEDGGEGRWRLLFFINQRLCSDVAALKRMCSTDLENLFFFINCSPFKSYCRFLEVCADQLMPIFNRSLKWCDVPSFFNWSCI